MWSKHSRKLYARSVRINMAGHRTLAELHTKLETYWGSAHANARRADDIYNRNFEGLLKLPTGIAVHQSSTGTLIVDGLRDQVHIDEPLVTFLTRGASQAALKEREMMEMWGRYVLRTIPEYETVNPFQQAIHDMLLRGATCIKHLVDVDNEVWPWNVRAIDPLIIFPAPGTKNPPRYVLEVQERYGADLMDKYPAWADAFAIAQKHSRKKGDIETYVATWREWWDKDEVVYEVDGLEVSRKKNPYGIIPYAWAYSGLGRANEDGDPRYLMVGILDSIKGEIEDEVRVKTAQIAQWLYHVFPRLLTQENAKAMEKKMQVGPGSVIEYSGEKPEWLGQPEPNQTMLLFLSEIQSNIFKKFGEALESRPSGVDAGIHQALLIGQSLKVIAPIKVALNNLGANLLNGMGRQMKALKLETSARGSVEAAEKERTIKGEEFRAFNFKVSFEATDPAENDRRMLAGLAVYRANALKPLISDRTFRRQYMRHVVDVEEEEEAQILAEQVVGQVIGSGQMAQLVLERLMGAEEEQKTGALEQQALEMAQGQLGGATEIAGAKERELEGVASVGVGTVNMMPAKEEVSAGA